ncbi:hypothetical protein [Nocardia gamkensis]|nr:hypothetical protein [Nocardia gamkensis]
MRGGSGGIAQIPQGVLDLRVGDVTVRGWPTAGLSVGPGRDLHTMRR